MARKKNKDLPLEMTWRFPTSLPAPGGEVEVAWCRFLEHTMRLTVAPVERWDLTGPHELSRVELPLVVWGWEVRINGDPVAEAEPVSFWDACYSAWAVFIELVPPFARTLTESIDARSLREQWDRAYMDKRWDYAYNVERGPAPGVGEPDPGADQDGQGTAGADAGAVRPSDRDEAAPGVPTG